MKLDKTLEKRWGFFVFIFSYVFATTRSIDKKEGKAVHLFTAGPLTASPLTARGLGSTGF